MNYLSFFLGNIVIICVSVLLELFYLKFTYLKKVFKEKIYNWFKIIFTGLVFSTLIILSYYFGNRFGPNNNNILGVGVLALIICVFCFDYKSGIIAGVVGFIFRIFFEFSSGDIFRYPVAVSLLCITLFATLVRLFLFKKNKIKWIYSIFIGLFAATFEMFLIILFNTSRISTIVEWIGIYDLLLLLFTSFSFCLTTIFIALLNKESIKIAIVSNKKLSTKVQRWLGGAVVASFVLAFSITYLVNFQKTNEESKTTLVNAVDDAYKQAEQYSSLEDMKKLATERRVMLQGFFVVTDNDNEIISIHSKYSDSLTDYFAIQVGTKSYEIRDYESDTAFIGVWNNVEYLISYKVSADGNYNIIALLPYKEIAASVGVSVRVVMYLLVIIFCMLFLLIDVVIDRMIVRSIYKVNKSLNKITDGDLNEEVKVSDSTEFAQLSNDINLTVGALKNYAGEVERRMEDEKQLAKEIQKGSVPSYFPNEKYFDIYASMTPAKEVGGDFYDFIKLSDDRVAFLIADVSGKGIPAAMFMMRARTYIKSLLSIDTPINDVVNKSNKELCQQNSMHMYVAAWFGFIDLKSGQLTYVNCGHTDPIIKNKDSGFKVLKGNKNFVLGVYEDFSYKTDSIVLKPGEDIFLFTDGIINVHNKENTNIYGIDKLIELVNNTQYFNAKQLVQIVNDDVNRYAGDGNNEQEDDYTMLTFRYTGAKEGKAEHEITLKAIPNNTPIATKFVESIMQQYNCSMKSQAIMLIAVDELFSNIAYYAYKGQPRPGNGTIQIKIRGQEFYLILMDQGVPFDPLAHLDPNYINSSAEERTNKGGLGIFMVRRSVDDMTYRYENGHNILTIKKIIPEMKEEVFKDSYSTTRD